MLFSGRILLWYHCKTKNLTLFCELMNKRMFSPIIGIISGISLLLIVLGTFAAWICERAAFGVFYTFLRFNFCLA